MLHATLSWGHMWGIKGVPQARVVAVAPIQHLDWEGFQSILTQHQQAPDCVKVVITSCHCQVLYLN